MRTQLPNVILFSRECFFLHEPVSLLFSYLAALTYLPLPSRLEKLYFSFDVLNHFGNANAHGSLAKLD